MPLNLKTLAPVALLGVLALAPMAHADSPFHHGPYSHGPYSHGINARQTRQSTRIERGEASGRLTPREASRLEARDARIARQEAHARASGGRFTYGERRRIQGELNRSNRAIYRQDHDRQGR